MDFGVRRAPVFHGSFLNHDAAGNRRWNDDADLNFTVPWLAPIIFLLRVHLAPAAFSPGCTFHDREITSPAASARLLYARRLQLSLHLSSRASCSSTARRIHAVRHQPASPHIRVAGNTQFPGQFCSSSRFGIAVSSAAAELLAGGLSASERVRATKVATSLYTGALAW